MAENVPQVPQQSQPQQVVKTIVPMKKCMEECVKDLGDAVVAQIVRFIHDRTMQEAVLSGVIQDIIRKCMNICTG